MENFRAILEQSQKHHMVSGSHSPTSFFDIVYLVSLGVVGQRPQRQLRGSQKQQGVSRELGVGRAPNFGPKAIRKS